MVVVKVSWFHDIFQALLPNIRRMIAGRVPKPAVTRDFQSSSFIRVEWSCFAAVQVQKAMSGRGMPSAHQMQSL
jgi:hypothetical protein